ncbi:flagellar motor stator protein MotA [Shewanella eurypsychrophilus]|uniref:Flagellar motor stator protein MotA n=1 Tax=Shewanella eurypsychrophilus TaxID=2593656 RepID=A0ABX6V0D0_9GAMM|nr:MULTISPECIES: flagellar motor stator protein MotA [Shewanella]QFU20461.1 flagellar motor stator protein MotA [Shewanella sp. YLB-09]QFU20743.1 flagellar motor stator protein MotA [Shewanella sp. YLB-09]QPG56038.1 flagellar motor stator protein MotA [Shewanella eurypsychrophilus]
MSKILGLVIILLSVFGGYVWAGGNLSSLWQPAEFLIIFGAGTGALIIANPKPVLEEMASQLKELISIEKEDPELYPQLFGLMGMLMSQIQSQGLKVLDEHVEKPRESSLFLMYPTVLDHPNVLQFLIDNLRLQSIGKISPHDLEHILEEEIYRIEEDRMRPSHALARVAEAMPGFGILAAVMGIIITMSSIDGPITMIGVKVAAALVGTFIGIFACYCLFEPISKALEHLVERKSAQLRCVAAILTSFAKGKPPMLAIDAGRKQIQSENRPSFVELERWMVEQKS